MSDYTVALHLDVFRSGKSPRLNCYRRRSFVPDAQIRSACQAAAPVRGFRGLSRISHVIPTYLPTLLSTDGAKLLLSPPGAPIIADNIYIQPYLNPCQRLLCTPSVIVFR